MKKFKKIIYILFLALSVNLCAEGIKSERKIFENCFEYILENGLKVFIAENHSVPLTYVEIAVRTGAISQKPENAGLFHLYEHMMFKGNEKFVNQAQVQKELNSLGTASWNGSTSVECVNYYFTVPSKETRRGLEFWSYAIRKPLMTEKEFEEEKKVVISEIEGKRTLPEWYASSYIAGKMFPDAPWQLDPSGSKEIVGNATVEQLLKIKETFYIPENSSLYIGGDVEHEKVIEMVKEIYGDWSNNGVTVEQIKAASVKQNPKPFIKPELCVVPYSKIDKMAQIQVFYRGPDSDLDRNSTYAADLLLNYMNNPAGEFVNDFASDEKLKIMSNQHIATSYLTKRLHGEISFVSIVLEPDENLADRVLYFYKKINDTVKNYLSSDVIIPEKDKEIIIQRLKDDDVYSVETAKGLLSQLRVWNIICDTDYYLTYNQKMQETTDADIKKYLAEYIADKNPLIVVYVNPVVYYLYKDKFDEKGFVEVNVDNAYWWNNMEDN